MLDTSNEHSAELPVAPSQAAAHLISYLNDVSRADDPGQARLKFVTDPSVDTFSALLSLLALCDRSGLEHNTLWTADLDTSRVQTLKATLRLLRLNVTALLSGTSSAESPQAKSRKETIFATLKSILLRIVEHPRNLHRLQRRTNLCLRIFRRPAQSTHSWFTTLLPNTRSIVSLFVGLIEGVAHCGISSPATTSSLGRRSTGSNSISQKHSVPISWLIYRLHRLCPLLSPSLFYNDVGESSSSGSLRISTYLQLSKSSYAFSGNCSWGRQRHSVIVAARFLMLGNVVGGLAESCGMEMNLTDGRND